MKVGDNVVSNVSKKNNKTGTVYCKAGDKVTIKAIHGDVLIVEVKGNRFSINKSDIKN